MKHFFFLAQVLWFGFLMPVFSAVHPAGNVGDFRQDNEDREYLLRYGVPYVILYNLPDSESSENMKCVQELAALIVTDPLNAPDTLRMEKKDGGWQTQYVLNDTSIQMILLSFQATDKQGHVLTDLYEDNDGEYRDLFVYDEEGRPVRGAFQTRALLHSGFGGLWDENLDLAYEDCEEEMFLYPDNYSARSLQISILLRQNGYSEKIRREIDDDIDNMLSEQDQTEALFVFAVSAYRMIGELEKAKTIEEDYLDRKPGSERAVLKELEEIIKLDKSGERLAKLKAFVDAHPRSRYTEFAYSTMASAAIDLDDLEEMLHIGNWLLKNSTTPSGASGLAGLAGALSENSASVDRSAAYIQKALEIIHSVSTASNPPEIPPDKWKEQLTLTTGRYRDIWGKILVSQEKPEEALVQLQMAAEKVSQSSIYYHTALAYRKIGDRDATFQNYARASLFDDKISDKAYEALNELWNTSQKSPDELDTFLDEQREWLENFNKKQLLNSQIRRPAPDFELQDLKKEWVRLSDQKDTVILLCFWATWSRSSKDLILELETLYKDFGEKVLFVTVATDVERTSVVKFVQKNRLRLPVLLNDDTDKDYNLQGVPAVYVIDKKGNIRFEHKGYQPDLMSLLKVELQDLL